MGKIRDNKWSVYKDSKQFSIPWSTFKNYVSKYLTTETDQQIDLSLVRLTKMGKPFGMSSELEAKLVIYIQKMQELGFGLTVNQVRHIAYKLVEQSAIPHPFNKTKKI